MATWPNRLAGNAAPFRLPHHLPLVRVDSYTALRLAGQAQPTTVAPPRAQATTPHPGRNPHAGRKTRPEKESVLSIVNSRTAPLSLAALAIKEVP